jgi:hypothetical protein
VGLLLLGKGAVSAHRFDWPRVAGLDDTEQRAEQPDRSSRRYCIEAWSSARRRSLQARALLRFLTRRLQVLGRGRNVTRVGDPRIGDVPLG